MLELDDLKARVGALEKEVRAYWWVWPLLTFITLMATQPTAPSPAIKACTVYWQTGVTGWLAAPHPLRELVLNAPNPACGWAGLGVLLALGGLAAILALGVLLLSSGPLMRGTERLLAAFGWVLASVVRLVTWPLALEDPERGYQVRRRP